MLKSHNRYLNSGIVFLAEIFIFYWNAALLLERSFYKFHVAPSWLARPGILHSSSLLRKIFFLILYSMLLAAARQYFIYREIRHDEA